jgi:hypothetical protein
MPLHNDWRREIYRASRLDEFRRYQGGEHYDGSEYTAADFIERLTTHTESPAMAAGTAVHAVIEEAAFGDLPEETGRGGWHIRFDLDAELRLPAAREIPLYREHKGIPLFGRVDAIDAVSVHDVKTTSAIDVDRYVDSMQWKAYCWMSGRRSFVYDLFRVKVEADIQAVTVLEYVRLPLTAYPGLDRDVESLLEEYDAAIRALGIGEKLAA